MDEKTIEQQEGKANLERLHHENGHRCLCLLWVLLGVLISGTAVNLWADSAKADLRQIVATQQTTISAMAATIQKLQ